MPNSRRTLRILIVFALAGLCAAPAASARTQQDPYQLFEIDVPDGWVWREQERTPRSGIYTVIHAHEPQMISVSMVCTPGQEQLSPETRRTMLEDDEDVEIATVVEPKGGKVLKRRETKLGGRFARELEYRVPTEEGYEHEVVQRTAYGSCIFSVGGLTIHETGKSSRQKADLKEIMRTFTFLKEPVMGRLTQP